VQNSKHTDAILLKAIEIPWEMEFAHLFVLMAKEERADGSLAVLMAFRTNLPSVPTRGTGMMLPSVAAIDA
jgi:hypothetical protein